MSNTDFDPDDVGPPIDFTSRRAQALVASSVEAEPDKAVRAIQIADALGTSPAAVHENLEQFEDQYKNALSSQIVASNTHLQDYVNSHPLAAKVSNDDYGQLDAVSQSLSKYAGVPGVGYVPEEPNSILKAGVRGFRENFAYEETNEEYNKLALTLASNPVFSNIFVRQATLAGAVALRGSMQLAAGIIGGAAEMIGESYRQAGGNEAQAARLTRDLIQIAQVGLSGQAGLHGVVHPEVHAMVNEAARVAKVVEPYVIAGKEPPIGLHPVIDEFKSQQAKLDAENLSEALRESVKSATRERSPDLFANYIRGITDGEIGISADAVRALYGDKLPTPDDGILGFVPDLAAQLARAEATGGDVKVPLADWLARVEPEVAKELKDHIRARPEGMTVEEAKEPPGIEAYHGSPYEFEAFDTGKIGTGEGAQSYGYGHYLAEHPEVAESYRGNLTHPTRGIGFSDAADEALGWINDAKGDKGKAKELYLENAARNKEEPDPNILEHFKEGSFYKARILRAPEEFLDWDKRLDEQGELGQKILKAIDKDEELKNFFSDATKAEDFRHLTGAGVHQGLEEYAGFARLLDENTPAEFPVKDVAEFLRREGIAGIRYLDQFSRQKRPVEEIKQRLAEAIERKDQKMVEFLQRELEDTSGPNTYNYVVFSDKDIQVIERNGEAVRSLRQAAGLQGIQERKLSLREQDEVAYPQGKDGDKTYAFDFIDEQGTNHGFIAVTEEKGGKRLYVDDMGADKGPRALGPRAMRDVLEQLKERFPNAETLEGYRVSGARLKAGEDAVGKSSLDLTKIKPRAKAPEEPKPGLIQRAKEAIVGKSEDQVAAEAKAQDERTAFDKASAIGMTVEQYKRYQALIEKRAREDAEAAQARAMADQRKRQTAEWKANRAELRPQVKEEVLSRPEVELDEMLREGKVKLAPEGLTPDQALLLKDYVSADGIHAQDLAGLFGDTDSKALVDRVLALQQGRDQAGMKPEAHLQRLIDIETDRQMEAKYGSLDKNILEEAKDQVLSETQEDLLHEETLARATEAGLEFSIGKEEYKAALKGFFDRQLVRDVSSDQGLAEAGRAGRAAEMALLKGDYAEAFRQKQRQYNAVVMANYARKFEKEQARFEKLAKRFSSREVPGVEQEYTNWVHDILGRTGNPVKRSVEDLAGAIDRSEQKTLADFVEFKELHDMREVPVAEFLQDPEFRKRAEDLTTAEFQALHDSIRALAKNGRDELKLIKAGEEFDLNEKKREMIAQLAQFKEKHYDASGGRWMGPLPPAVARPLRTYLVSHLQLESIFNRWDRGDPRGVFTQFIARELATAANSEAALEREFATKLRAVADKADLKERVPNELFKDPLGGASIQMTRKNLRAILLNVGNDSNLTKLARGYLGTVEKGDVGRAQVEGFKAQVMQWLHTHATKEDWDWAQGIWNTFADIKKRSDTMYRSLTGGVEPESIPVRAIETPHGTYPGGYYPVIYHPVWEGASKKLMGGDILEQENYVRATTPAGYTKQRTGYAAPLSLDLDMMPVRMRQMLHDIAFRPSVIQAGKIFYDKDVRAAITKHYGTEYTKMLVPYLRDVANAANYRNDAQQVFTRFSELVRQNIIATLIGLNPGTVLKHGPTAAVNSVTEVGLGNFLRAMKGLFSINEGTGETNWSFALKTSEELQRRHRFYRETMGGAMEEIQGERSLRDNIIRLGSYPVAMSDLLSAVPTWMAKYQSEMGEHGIHGDAVFAADRAVRRAHGSSVITNRPLVMRTGPLGSWFASLYGFFNHIMNRQYELAWKAGDTLDLVKKGEYKKAMAEVPGIAGMLFSYVIAPAIIEELVTPLASDKKESWGMKAAKSLTYTVSASWIVVREIASAVLNGRDPSMGLLTTAAKTVTDTVRDLEKDKPFSKRNAGRLIQHSATTLGAATGLVNAQVGKSGRFIYDYANGLVKPKGPWGWMVGLRYGTLDKHSQTFDQWMKGH